jgi:hypothetical protein
MREGWKIGESHHPQASWIVTANHDTGLSIAVVQPANAPDRIDVQTAVRIDENHQKQIVTIDAKQRQDLWWRLRFDLLRLGVDFQGFDEPIRQINVMQRMYDDGLTKDRFLQRVGKIKNAQILVIWSVQRALNQPPGDDILNEGFIN